MRPEVVLWLEVLLTALADFAGDCRDVRHAQTRARCQREAALWFHSNDREPGSFLFACEAADIDPGAVRRALLNANIPAVRQRLKNKSDFVERPFTDSLENPRFECTAGRRVTV